MKTAVLAMLLLAGCGAEQKINDPCAVVAAYSQDFAKHPTRGSKMLIGDSITYGLGAKEGWVNRGIPGNASMCLNQEFAQHIALEEPEEVIIAIGINDVHMGMPLDQFAINYARFVDTLLGNGVTVKIRSILPSNLMPERIPDYNARLMAIAENRDVEYLNTYPYFAIGNGGIILDYTTDGTHLSNSGYAVYLDHFGG